MTTLKTFSKVLKEKVNPKKFLQSISRSFNSTTKDDKNSNHDDSTDHENYTITYPDDSTDYENYTTTAPENCTITELDLVAYEDYIASRFKVVESKVKKANQFAIRDNKWLKIHLAAGSGDLELVKASCNEKNINIPDAKGRTPLELAILGGNLEIVKFLVQNGGKTAPNMYGWSSIHAAIRKGNLEIVKYLYENTEFQKCDKYGKTIHDYAAAIGNEQIVQFFLSKNKTPLESAVDAKDISSINMLISKGVKFDIKSELGKQIFNFAIEAKDIKLAEYLTNKFLGNKPDNNQTLLEKIIQIHDKKIDIAKLAKTIIEKENYSEIDNILGQRLLGKAFQANDFDLVQTLHSKGVKLDYKDMLGRTALHFAIKSGAGEEIIQFLVDNITDINTRDKSGSTYLHWAANNHHTLAAKLLVDKGAYSFMPDYLGKTPLKLAECYGDRDMMEILGDHTA